MEGGAVTPDLSDLLPAEVKQMFFQEKRTISQDFSEVVGPGGSLLLTDRFILGHKHCSAAPELSCLQTKSHRTHLVDSCIQDRKSNLKPETSHRRLTSQCVNHPEPPDWLDRRRLPTKGRVRSSSINHPAVAAVKLDQLKQRML